MRGETVRKSVHSTADSHRLRTNDRRNRHEQAQVKRRISDAFGEAKHTPILKKCRVVLRIEDLAGKSSNQPRTQKIEAGNTLVSGETDTNRVLTW